MLHVVIISALINLNLIFQTAPIFLISVDYHLEMYMLLRLYLFIAVTIFIHVA